MINICLQGIVSDKSITRLYRHAGLLPVFACIARIVDRYINTSNSL